MIRDLVKHSPAMRALPRWLVLAATLASFELGAVAWASHTDGVLPESSLLGVVWLVLTLYLVFGARSFGTPFQMTLPIPSRTLWLSHVTSVVIASASVLAVAVASSVLGLWFLYRVSGKWFVEPAEIGPVVAFLFAGTMLGVAALQNPKTAIGERTRTARGVLMPIAIAAGILAVLFALQGRSPWIALLLLSMAVLIAFGRYRGVPDAFRPADPTPASTHAPVTYTPQAWVNTGAPMEGDRFAWFSLVTAWRSLFTGAKRKHSVWVIATVLVLFGAVLSALTDLWTDETLRFAYTAMAAYVLLAFSVQPLAALHRLDTLPISRRRLFAVVIVPPLLFLSIGYGLGNTATSVIERRLAPEPLIEYVQDKDGGHYNTRVPARFCKLAWGGEPPQNESSWQESHDAWRTPLHKGSFIKLYSPFSTPPGSSLEFVALQISRATEAVYGEAIPPQEIQNRYLELQQGGTVVGLKGDALTIHSDFPHLQSRSAGAVFPVLMVLAGLLWLFLLYVYLHALRAGVSRRARVRTYWGLLAFAMLVWFSYFVFDATDFMEIWVFSGALQILIGEASTALPGGPLVVWLACAVVFGGGYRLVQRRFERVELPVGESCESCAVL